MGKEANLRWGYAVRAGVGDPAHRYVLSDWVHAVDWMFAHGTAGTVVHAVLYRKGRRLPSVIHWGAPVLKKYEEESYLIGSFVYEVRELPRELVKSLQLYGERLLRDAC